MNERLSSSVTLLCTTFGKGERKGTEGEKEEGKGYLDLDGSSPSIEVGRRACSTNTSTLR